MKNDVTPAAKKIKKICVYCGSGPGNDPAYMAAAREFGAILAQNKIGLVYGGGSVGIMGAVSDAVRDNGGDTLGIIPNFLVKREHAHPERDGLLVTSDMHERKRMMFEKADAFVALPGGIGTLEELVEQLTWIQLGRHKKPVVLANINGFWDPLCALIEHMRALEFIRAGLDFNLIIVERVQEILPRLHQAMAPVEPHEKEMKDAQPHQL
ncbi:MAG: TIGR00730 family Rossman fold protein [Pseudolabrys sp.]|nr:TIGR00730 family Rossman fold protein [Pseudolabrys sp.]MBV9956308.1 TIGR00730 family Rossman fold protein [Pseudolabrys sp.]